MGGILPVLFPLQLTFWPFGIVSIPSHPRMDSIPWPNSYKMAIVCLTAPITMLLTGLILYVLGFILTPEVMPGLNDTPTKLNPALFPELIVGLLSGGSEESLATYWLHPLGLAGTALMMMAWLSLLPLPTLPGGRILVALLGIEDAAKICLIDKNNVFDHLVVKVKNAYPFYDLDYKTKLISVVQFFEKRKSIACLGRTGIFRYNNSDGSIEMAFQLAKKYKEGKMDSSALELTIDKFSY